MTRSTKNNTKRGEDNETGSDRDFKIHEYKQ